MREPMTRTINPAATSSSRSPTTLSSTGAGPAVHAPRTGPFSPGVEHGTEGAAPITGEGSVIATTNAKAASPNAAEVQSRRAGRNPRPNRNAPAQTANAITKLCAGVKTSSPKTLVPPGSKLVPQEIEGH